MKRFVPLRRFVPVMLGTLLALSCASGHREPYSGEEAVVRGLPGFEAALRQAVQDRPGVTVGEAGRVTAAGFDAPILLVRIERAGAARRVLVCAGIHGNEPAGIAWALRLAGELAADPALYPGISFDIIPLLNPWGWSRDVRYDRGGRDPNRDFATFDTEAARAVRELSRRTRYDLVLDHHEDPDAKGFYVYQYADRDTRPTRGLIAKVRDLGFPVEQDVTMVILRTKDGLIQAPRWGLWYMRAGRRLSMTNWLRLQGVPKVYTVETPTLLAFEDRVLLHRTAFDALVHGNGPGARQ